MSKKKATNIGTMINEGYDYSVAARMAGRAGAKSVKGGKGIAFEVMYADKLNTTNMIKGNGLYTTFTKSSTAKQVDLITKNGKINIERIQCKDTPSISGINKTLNQAKNGKYKAVQYVGTTETAQAFNTKAASRGISKVMKDTGISTKDTSRISNKFNGVASTIGIGNIALNSAKFGGALSGGFAAIESFVNGDDLGDTASNITSNALKGAIASGIGTTASEGTMFALAAAPIPLAAKVAIGIGVGLGAGNLASEFSEDFCEGVGDIAGTVVESVGDAAIGVAEVTTDIAFGAIESSLDFAGGVTDMIGSIVNIG